MVIDHIGSLLATLVALSLANERLVELFKKMFKFLDTSHLPPAPPGSVAPAPSQKNIDDERKRYLYVYLLTLACSFATVLMAKETVVSMWAGIDAPVTLDVKGSILSAFLISAGSKFWNPILEAIKQFKDNLKP